MEKKRRTALKVLLCLALAAAMSLTVVFAAGCTVKEYEGEYHYANAWDDTAPDYGIKVKVKVQTDKKGDRIRKVEVVDSDYVSATDTDKWDKQIWLDGLNELLANYRGRYLADVLCETVKTTNGQPDDRSGQLAQNKTFDGLIITGATQGSGRLLLAVQDALSKAAKDLGYEIKEGEYHYANAWDKTAPDYGIKVQVVTKDGIICGVKMISSDYADYTSSWNKKSLWLNGLDGLLETYKGRSVSEVLGITVLTDDGGQPKDSIGQGTPEGQTAFGGLVVTGATQGSGRLLLAVQNALKN